MYPTPHTHTQANSDDPPFLNVGTEVSAKYRGAFCEATIKVAKKLVKCKVSEYTMIVLVVVMCIDCRYMLCVQLKVNCMHVGHCRY